MVQEKIKHGTVTYETHFMEIRILLAKSEEFVSIVNQKIEEGWKLINISAAASHRAYFTK